MSVSTRTLLLVCGVFLAAGTLLASVGPSLPFLAERAGQELATLSWLFTAFSGGVVVAQLGVGRASDRFGLRAVLGGGMAIMGAAYLGVSAATGLAAILSAAALAGLGFGGVITAGNVLVARIFADHSATALNGANVFFGLGSILGPVVAGQAGARLGLPQAGLWLGGGLMLALTPFILWLAGSPGAPGRAGGEVGPAESPASIWPLGVLLLIYTGTEVGFGGWVTVYMTRSAGLSLADAALVAAGFWMALTGGRVLGAALGLRITPRALLLVSLAGMLAGAALMALGVGDYWRSLAGALLLGLSCGPVFPTALAVITTAARGSNRAAGLALGLGNCGGLILPALFGLLLASYGPPAMIGVVLACTAAMLALSGVILTPTEGVRVAAPPSRLQ